MLASSGAAIAVVYGTWPGDQGHERRHDAEGRPVAAATAVSGDVPIAFTGLGSVTSLATVTVRTQINGRLTDLGFQEGQLVRNGDFLAQIDPRPYQYARDRAEAQLLRDRALLRNAQLDLQRYNLLLRQNSVSAQQVDSQSALVQQDEANVKLAEAQLNDARLNIEYCRIVAPITGRVGLRQVDLGNYVQTSDPNGIVVITQIQPITVVFSIPEDRLPEIASRVAQGATLSATAYGRDGTREIATGALTSVDNMVDSATGTVKLKAQFDNTAGALFPNQFVNVRLVIDELHGATLIPGAAVQRGEPGTFVFVVNDDSRIEVHRVRLGPSSGDRVAVLAGLEPGARVVVDGTDRVREGTRVSVIENVHEGHPILAEGSGHQEASLPARIRTSP